MEGQRLAAAGAYSGLSRLPSGLEACSGVCFRPEAAANLKNLGPQVQASVDLHPVMLNGNSRESKGGRSATCGPKFRFCLLALHAVTFTIASRNFPVRWAGVHVRGRQDAPRHTNEESSKLKTKLFAVLGALSLMLGMSTARAEGDAVDVRFYSGTELVPAAEKIAAEQFQTDAGSLQQAGVSLLAYAMWMDNQSSCAVDIGYARFGDRFPGAPFKKGWAVSAQRPGESRESACERTFRKAIEYMREGENLPEVLRATAASDTPNAGLATPRNLPAEPRTVHSYTSGLNPEAQSAVPDLVGERFTQTFDYRKFAVYIALMPYKSEEGKIGCIVRTGLTARSQSGARYRLPPYLYTRFGEQQPGWGQCPKTMLQAAVSRMASDVLSEESYGQFKTVAEPGVKYPTRSELLASQAAFDRQVAKRQRESEARERKVASVQSQTTSRNVLRCTNQCVNGSCVRTFEDGRKERWQAPRVFRFGNWEWDTTTNACGG